MKKLHLILVLIALTGSVNSQSYFQFPTSNASWCGDRTFQYFNGGSDQRHSYGYQEFINGDTVINSLTYHKIFENGTFSCVYLFQPLSCGSYNYTNEYKGAFREDGFRKVFFIAKDSLNEMLLYDFTLTLYDTLPWTYNQTLYSNGINLWVSGVDSVFDGTNYRRRYNISRDTAFFWETNYVSIIEGIGSTHGLLWDINPYAEANGSLFAHKQNGIILYPDTSVDCIISSISNIISETPFSVYPNPVKNEFTFYSKQLAVCDMVKIFDVMGKEVLKTKIDKPTSNIRLQTSTLSNGIYFVEYKSGNEVYRNKFVKQ